MKKRRLLSIVLSLCMVLALMPQMVFADTISSGSCGTNLIWSLDDNGTLTITGTGAMNDWSNSKDIPWYTNSSSIETVVIDSGVTSIGMIAFINCTSLTSVTIPNSVTSIGISAFYDCTSLTSVTIPDSVKSIGTGVFGKCTSLTSVTISNGVTSIGSKTFDECTSLENITIPDGVTSIGNDAFFKCTSLKNVTFEKGSKLTSIASEAFRNCTKLESIEIPGSVTSIGANAFLGCTSLDSIFLLENLNSSGAAIPETASQVKYSLDSDKGEVTITKIELGTGKTRVAIPATIWGYPVVAISDDSLLKMISSHTCVGGTPTCQTKAVCGICKQEYGDYANHSLIKIGAKAASCTENGNSEYWTCTVCKKMFSDENGTTETTQDAVTIRAAGHTLNKTDGKEASATETGNIEYWQCEKCKKYFADENGENEITLDETVISKLPPEIIKGMDQSVTVGEKKVLTFRSNALFDDFDKVELDGDTLDTEYYTAESGSIIVTLDADYVATLPVGEHTIGIVSESGTAETTFTVEKKAAPGSSDDSDKDSKSDEDSAKTGDDTNLALWLALMLLSGAGITGVTAFARRKRTNE